MGENRRAAIARYEEKLARGVESEPPRVIDHVTLVADAGEPARVRIDREDGDAAVPAARCVKKLARRMDGDMRAERGARRGADALERRESSRRLVEREREDHAVALRDDVGEPLVGRERHVPRAPVDGN